MRYWAVILVVGVAVGVSAGEARADELTDLVEQQAKDAAPGTKRVGEFLRGSAVGRKGKVEWHVPLEAGQCYWFSAFGDGGVDRLSLSLDNPNGGFFSGVASQSSRTAGAVVQHCPEMNGVFVLQAKAARGEGDVAAAVYAKKALAKSKSPEEIEKEKHIEELTRLVRSEAKSVAPGAEQVGDLFESEADTQDWFTALEAGRCYWFVTVGEPDISKLWLSLFNPTKDMVAKSWAGSRKATVGYCPKADGMYRIKASVKSGSGTYKLGLFSKKG